MPGLGKEKGRLRILPVDQPGFEIKATNYWICDTVKLKISRLDNTDRNSLDNGQSENSLAFCCCYYC